MLHLTLEFKVIFTGSIAAPMRNITKGIQIQLSQELKRFSSNLLFSFLPTFFLLFICMPQKEEYKLYLAITFHGFSALCFNQKNTFSCENISSLLIIARFAASAGRAFINLKVCLVSVGDVGANLRGKSLFCDMQCGI